MLVLKFGGTSVGSAERMHHVAQLIAKKQQPQIVVLSAVSGTTNQLVAIAAHASKQQHEQAQTLTGQLKQHYEGFVQQLLHSPKHVEQANAFVGQVFALLSQLAGGTTNEKEILAQGELLSTRLFLTYLNQEGIEAAELPALDFMRIDADAEPDMAKIRELLKSQLAAMQGQQLLVTQGYICRNHEGNIDNLKRGGSDYTASLVGAAILAREIQIWTDIDGIHNNDPRVVQPTYPIAALSFEEAAELAYFGAKILHPFSIRPAQQHNIPVRLLNTMQPEAKGSLINNVENKQGIKAIAAKDGITAIKIKSTRMLLAYGFLTKVFQVFEQYKTPIDMITTSEVAISLTIDDDTHLEEICAELNAFGHVMVDHEMSIVCIVGDRIADKRGIVKRVFEAIETVPIRMISYGGSKNNISVLIDTDSKVEALTKLNEGLFSPQPARV